MTQNAMNNPFTSSGDVWYLEQSSTALLNGMLVCHTCRKQSDRFAQSSTSCRRADDIAWSFATSSFASCSLTSNSKTTIKQRTSTCALALP